MEILVPFDGISVEWEELKQTLQGCEDSLMVASRLQSFIQVSAIELPIHVNEHLNEQSLKDQQLGSWKEDRKQKKLKYKQTGNIKD